MDNSLTTYFLGGALGVLLQILFKIQELKKQSKIANHSFSLKEYLSDDWASILASFVSVGVGVFVIDELLKAKPQLAQYIKWFFVFVGFSGASLIQSVLSVTAKKIDQIIDLKTNQADGITPAIDSTNSEAVVLIQKDKEKVEENLNKSIEEPTID